MLLSARVRLPLRWCRYTQKWFLDFCDAIDTAEDAFDIRKVYEADDVVPVPVKCPFESFQTWYVPSFHGREIASGSV